MSMFTLMQIPSHVQLLRPRQVEDLEIAKVLPLEHPRLPNAFPGPDENVAGLISWDF